jgi:hypothetical protein
MGWHDGRYEWVGRWVAGPRERDVVTDGMDGWVDNVVVWFEMGGFLV